MKMRKMLTKEVTKTTVKLAKIVVENGLPQAVALPDEVILGNVQLENAQKQLNKKIGEPVTILQLLPTTETYEMPVEEFIQLATIKAVVAE
jgi:hypothetical protein